MTVTEWMDARLWRGVGLLVLTTEAREGPEMVEMAFLKLVGGPVCVEIWGDEVSKCGKGKREMGYSH